MSSSADRTGSGHPIGAVVARVRSELTALVDQPAWSLTTGQTREQMVEVVRLTTQVAELELRVAHQADATKAGEEAGATSTANWWSHTTRQTRNEAHRKIRLAHALDAHEPVRAAMARGEVLPDQAQMIIDAVQALPAMGEQAEKHLLAEAEHHDAKELKRLGRHVLGVLDPAAGEAHQAKVLEQEEARAAASARFTLTEDGQGRVHGRFTMPSAQGAMLKKALLAILAPSTRPPPTATYPDGAPGGTDGPGAVRVRRALPDRPAPHQRRRQRHRRGHDDPREPPGRPRLGILGHRRRDHGPARPDGWRARPGSSPRSSAPAPWSSTSGARPGSTPPASGSPSASSKPTAPIRVATGHPRCVTPTTTSPGAAADPPTSSTAACSAPDTTSWPTDRRRCGPERPTAAFRPARAMGAHPHNPIAAYAAARTGPVTSRARAAPRAKASVTCTGSAASSAYAFWTGVSSATTASVTARLRAP